MGTCVGIVASLSRSNIILTQADGAYIESAEINGVHWRASNGPPLINHIINLLLSTNTFGLPMSVMKSELTRCESIAVALSGVDPSVPDPILKTLMLRLGIGSIPLTQCSVVQAGYVGALIDKPGIVVRCGIGCSVFGRNSTGASHTTNSFSSLIGVPGSGYSIGQHVYWVAQKGADSRATSEEREFAKTLMNELPDQDFREFSQRVEQDRQLLGFHSVMQHVYDLAQKCVAIAERNDPVAIGILNNAAAELVQGIETVSLALSLGDEDEVPIVFRGGMAQHCHPFCRRVVLRLQETDSPIRFAVEPGGFSPVVGAAMIALRNRNSSSYSTSRSKFLSSLPSDGSDGYLYAANYYDDPFSLPLGA